MPSDGPYDKYHQGFSLYNSYSLGSVAIEASESMYLELFSLKLVNWKCDCRWHELNMIYLCMDTMTSR